MPTVQYNDLSPKAKETLFAARKIHGFDGAKMGDFEAWAQKFVPEFSQQGESALIPHDAILRMYFTLNAKVAYIDLDPRNEGDNGGLLFTAAAALEAVPDNAPMLDLDGDHCICAVRVRVGGEEMYISLHEAEMTRAVVIDMAVSFNQLANIGIHAPIGSTSCHTAPGKIIYVNGSTGQIEERDLEHDAAKMLKTLYGINGPLRCAITGAGR